MVGKGNWWNRGAWVLASFAGKEWKTLYRSISHTSLVGALEQIPKCITTMQLAAPWIHAASLDCGHWAHECSQWSQSFALIALYIQKSKAARIVTWQGLKIWCQITPPWLRWRPLLNVSVVVFAATCLLLGHLRHLLRTSIYWASSGSVSTGKQKCMANVIFLPCTLFPM